MGEMVDGIDESALEEVQEYLGTSNRSDTVNAALREMLRLRLVSKYVESMSLRDPDELDALQAEAWR
ncbi:hypothetical protein [Nocardia tengchongensis]